MQGQDVTSELEEMWTKTDLLAFSGFAWLQFCISPRPLPLWHLDPTPSTHGNVGANEWISAFSIDVSLVYNASGRFWHEKTNVRLHP